MCPELGLSPPISVDPPVGPVFEIAPPAPPTLLVVPVSGPVGPRGAPGSGSAETFTVTAVSSWTRAHDFAYYPDVRLVDAAGEANDIAVEYPDAGHVSLSFPAPFTGTIILS